MTLHWKQSEMLRKVSESIYCHTGEYPILRGFVEKPDGSIELLIEVKLREVRDC